MDTIAERYELRESLGSGGMAHVYAAHDVVLDRRIALKLLRQDIGADPTLRARFLREARLAGSLNHRNIVRVYDAGVHHDTPWMAMELVDGPSLRDRMTSIGQYPLDDALLLMEGVLPGLGAAHTANVVHRDVKPANILLADDGVKLGDFGIAKSLEAASTAADLTQMNQFLGTPKYTAPEVAMGQQAAPRSDVYSAAVVFWEMLAGVPPYEHDNPLSLAMMHRTDPLPSLAAIRPDLPGSVVAALEMALAKEPGDRPASAATFADMLASRSPSAAATPTQVLSVPAMRAAAAESTLLAPPAMAPSGPPPRPASRASRRSSGSSWGLALLVALLVGIAVAAFALVGDGSQTGLDGSGSEAESDPALVTTPTPSTSAVPPVQPSVDAPATDAQPAPPPAVAEPTTEPVVVPEPSNAPEPQPAATVEPPSPSGRPTPAAPPTAAPILPTTPG